MPRQTDRDFLALAISQNCKAWGTAVADPALPVIAFEQAAHAAQAAWLADRRARLVERIDDAIDVPDGFYRSVYFRLLDGGLAPSAEEAVDELRRLIRREVERSAGAIGPLHHRGFPRCRKPSPSPAISAASAPAAGCGERHEPVPAQSWSS